MQPTVVVFSLRCGAGAGACLRAQRSRGASRSPSQHEEAYEVCALFAAGAVVFLGIELHVEEQVWRLGIYPHATASRI